MDHLTEHAIERFVQHWRPGTGYHEAAWTLRSLVASAVGTRRKALGTPARIHLAHTERGERIPLVVRDRCVVTVLSSRTDESRGPAGTVRNENAASHISLARQRANLMARLFDDGIAAQRDKAESILASWRAGRPVARKTLRRVADVLGLPVEQLARCA